MINFVRISNVNSIWEQIHQIFIKISPEEMRALSRRTLLCINYSFQVAGFIGMILFLKFFNNLVNLFWVRFERVVFDIESNLFNGLSQHKLILFWFLFNSIHITLKFLINSHNFLEIKFLKINAQSSDKEVNQITLFKLVSSNTPQIF